MSIKKEVGVSILDMKPAPGAHTFRIALDLVEERNTDTYAQEIREVLKYDVVRVWVPYKKKRMRAWLEILFDADANSFRERLNDANISVMYHARAISPRRRGAARVDIRRDGIAHPYYKWIWVTDPSSGQPRDLAYAINHPDEFFDMAARWLAMNNALIGVSQTLTKPMKGE